MSKPYTERPSGVPGLVIWGRPPYLTLYWRHGETSLRIDPSKYNTFRLVRDAKAAARRLATAFDWEDPDLAKKIRDLDHEVVMDRLIEGLTGRTVKDLEAEHNERRETVNAWYSGETARSHAEELAEKAGHTPMAWSKQGTVRSWHGECACGAKFSASYRSVSDTYNYVGFGVSCSLIPV